MNVCIMGTWRMFIQGTVPVRYDSRITLVYNGITLTYNAYDGSAIRNKMWIDNSMNLVVGMSSAGSLLHLPREYEDFNYASNACHEKYWRYWRGGS